MIEAVTFDATGTLMTPRDLTGDYQRVLARHGVRTEAALLEPAIRNAWRELSCTVDPARDRFAAHSGGARGYWRRFVERVAALAGSGRPSPFAAAELFELFGREASWRVYDDVLPALERLAATGIRRAVISNWDERLPRLLERLDLARFFEAVVISQAVGVEKPHPRIFETALERLAVPAPRVLHVGDSAREDVEGALGIGMAALRLERAQDGGAAPGTIHSLLELDDRLGRFA